MAPPPVMSNSIEPVKPASTEVVRSSVAVLIERLLPSPFAVMPFTLATMSVPVTRALSAVPPVVRFVTKSPPEPSSITSTSTKALLP